MLSLARNCHLDEEMLSEGCYGTSFHAVMANAPDSESSDPSPYLGGTCSLRKTPDQPSSSTQTTKPNINRLPMPASTSPGSCFTSPYGGDLQAVLIGLHCSMDLQETHLPLCYRITRTWTQRIHADSIAQKASTSKFCGFFFLLLLSQENLF